MFRAFLPAATLGAALLGAFALVFSIDDGPALAATAPALTVPQLYWGATIDGTAYGDGNVPDDMRGVTTFEAHANKPVSIISIGNWWQGSGGWNAFPTSSFDNVRNHGSIPMFTWQSDGLNPAAFQNAIITSGQYDAYIHTWAQAARAWGHPFFMRFDHEMDGWWYPWGNGLTSPGGPVVNGNQVGDYAPMYRHVHDIFVQDGATNVTWVWSINHEAISSQYPPLAAIYPGDAYVDWTAIDPYNFYSGYWLTLYQLLTGQGTTWISNTYQKVLAVAPSKPMMLPEFGSDEASSGGTASSPAATARPAAKAMAALRPMALAAPRPSMTPSAPGPVQPPAVPADKPSWLRDTFLTELVYNFPAIKAVLYFNWGIDHADMPIESSPASQTAFAQGIGSPLYATNAFAGLVSSPILPLTTQVSWLPSIADTYVASDTPRSTAGGSSKSLTVNGSPTASRKAFVRFDLSALAGGTVDQAALQLTSTAAPNASSLGTINVKYVTTNVWNERSMNWNNSVPARYVGAPLGTLVSPSTVSTNYTIVLPAALLQAHVGMQMSFQLDESGTDDFVFASREVADPTQRPQLIVSYH